MIRRMAGIGGFARDADGFTIGRAATEAAWIPVARAALTGVAQTAHGTIAQSELAEEVQSRTGIRAHGQLAKWIGPFLAHTALACRDAGEPPLVALVVAADNGRVGPSYDAVLDVLGVETPSGSAERERLAAGHRIDCYGWAGAPEPAGGWLRRVPATRSATAPTRVRPASRASATPHARPEPAPPAVCPTCFMQLPATGRCDFCD